MKPQIYFCKNSIKLIAVFMLCFANAQKSSYFSNGTNFPIPDEGSFVYSTIVVTGIPEDAHIVHLDMQVRADHTYVGDLAMGLDMPNYQTLGLAHRPGTDAVSGSPFGNSANLSSENYIYFMDYADNASEKIGAGLLTDNITPAGNFYPSWNPEGSTYAFSSFTQIAKEYTGNKNGN